MEKQDLELEARVWQRVGGVQEAGEELREMEMRCRESAAVLRQLAGQSGGANRETLLRLSRETLGDAQMLRGMRILSGEEPERIPNEMAANVTLRRGLAQCFRRCQQAFHSYTQQAKSPDYGPVFSSLARTESHRMSAILQLIGVVQ